MPLADDPPADRDETRSPQRPVRPSGAPVRPAGAPPRGRRARLDAPVDARASTPADVSGDAAGDTVSPVEALPRRDPDTGSVAPLRAPVAMPRRVLPREPTAPPPLPAVPPATLPVAAQPLATPPSATSSAAPVRATAAPIPAAPSPAAALPPAPRRELTVLSHHLVGGGRSPWSASSTPAGSAITVAIKSPLEIVHENLPVLTAEDAPKRLRQQPAFIVSLIAAIVIVAGVATFLILQHVLRGPDAVEDLSVLDGGNNYVLQWNGPDVPYSVAVTRAPSQTIDVTRFIKGGRQAFVPKSGLGVSQESCFVVRSEAEAQQHTTIPTSAADLASEGGQKFCVGDIGK